MQGIHKRNNIQNIWRIRNIFQFCLYLLASYLVIIWSKSNLNHCRQYFSTGISFHYFSKYWIFFSFANFLYSCEAKYFRSCTYRYHCCKFWTRISKFHRTWSWTEMWWNVVRWSWASCGYKNLQGKREN